MKCGDVQIGGASYSLDHCSSAPYGTQHNTGRLERLPHPPPPRRRWKDKSRVVEAYADARERRRPISEIEWNGEMIGDLRLLDEPSQEFHAPRARAVRVQVPLSAGEIKALDDFRFERRMPSRAATVRELMRRGFQAVGASPARNSNPF